MNAEQRQKIEEEACRYCYDLYKIIRKVAGLVEEFPEYRVQARVALEKIDFLCYAFDSYVLRQRNENKMS